MQRLQRQPATGSTAFRVLIISAMLCCPVVSGVTWAATSSDQLLPTDTVASLVIHDVPEFKAKFAKTAWGRLFKDPAVTALFSNGEDGLLTQSLLPVVTALGMSVLEFLNLPTGELSLSLVVQELNWVVIALLDVGENQTKIQELLAQAIQKIEESGSVVVEEELEGVQVRYVNPPPDQLTPFQIAYFIRDQRLGILLGSQDQVSQQVTGLFSRWDGADEAVLANQDSYQQIMSRTSGGEGNVPAAQWYVNIANIVNKVREFTVDPSMAVWFEMIPQLGLDQIKAVGGSYDLVVEDFDSIWRTYLVMDRPASGVMNLMSLPNSHLVPQDWVPAEVASYSSLNWDIQLAWKTIGDLMDQFSPGAQPGQFAELVQNYMVLFGLDINVQNDIIDTLGGRISWLTEFRDPTDIATQQTLGALSLSNAQLFAQTLDKLLVIVGPQIQRREFQGHQLFEMEVPSLGMVGGVEIPGSDPGSEAPGELVPASKLAMTIAYDNLIFASDSQLLEKVLRQEQDRLIDSLDYQIVAGQFPEESNLLLFSRPEVQMQSTYEMVRSGQLQQTLGMVQQIPPFLQGIDGSMLPPFEAIARYFAPTGGYGVEDNTGMIFVFYTIRRESP